MAHLLSFDAAFHDADSFRTMLNWRVIVALLLNVTAWAALVAVGIRLVH